MSQLSNLGIRGPRVLAVIAAVLIAAALVVESVTGIRGFVTRVRLDSSSGLAELGRLECIEAAVAQLTRPGETVHLAPIEDGYLYQRTVGLIYPRLRLVEGDGLPLLSVSTGEARAGALRCADVNIEVVRDA